LVFKYEKTLEDLKFDLNKIGAGHDILSGVGVFVTSDGHSFKRLIEANPDNKPKDLMVDNHLDILLSPDDKEKLLEIKYKYYSEEVIIPSIS
jgi:hypothetical protein